MYEDAGTTLPKLPLDAEGEGAVQRLGRWMRVVGTIQLALMGMLLLFLLMGFVCGFAAAGVLGGGVALLVSLIPVVIAAVFLLQGLRTQEAGEQIKNLADEHDIDYLELAFVRLKTVFIIDIVVGVLLTLGELLGGGA
jgi:hypothetical protein